MKKDISSSNEPMIIDRLQQFATRRYSYSDNDFFYYTGESDIVFPYTNSRIEPNDKWCLIYYCKGIAQCTCNKQQYLIEAPCIVAIPPNTLFENVEHKGKTEIIVIVSSNYSLSNPFLRFTIITLDNNTKDIVDKHFGLLEQSIRHSYHKAIATNLIDALLIGLRNCLAKDTDSVSAVNDSRKHLYNHFVDLAIEHGLTQRNIPFYAKALQITPNYLSSVVKSESGMTVIEWLNQRIIREAKALLLHSEKPVYEVAENLGFNNTSFFIKFFKRNTGLSPRIYRTSKKLPNT